MGTTGPTRTTLARVLLGGLCATGRPVALVAQAVGPRSPAAESARQAEPKTPRVLLAAGIDADGHAGSAYPPQLALHVGYQLAGGERVGGSRFGLRAGLDFTASNAGPTSTRLDYPIQTRRSRGLGGVLLGTYALTRGPVRPYLIGGGGVYVLRSSATYATFTYSPSGRPKPSPRERVNETHLGVTLGAGLSAPVRRVVLFGETRATIMPTAILSDTPGLRGSQLPIVLGVRF